MSQYHIYQTDADYRFLWWEVAKDKFVTRFVKADSSEITRSFYYEEPEGEYICVRTLGGLFQFSKSFEKANNYKWLNGKFDQVDFENKLKAKGFSSESASALTAAMGVADVLTGERKDEAEGVGIGGFTISDLLDKM